MSTSSYIPRPSKLLKSFSMISALLSILLPALSSAQGHEVYDPDFSIGLVHPFSEDRQTIPGFTIHGSPQLLSDRLVLTPPSPGNQRVGLWTTKTNPYHEWTLDVNFRTSGGERPGGSFHVWYTAGGAHGKVGMESVYTSKPWDGLALVVDSYGGYGTIRAYLNDGSTDYSIHHNVPSLSFGHCEIHYRNRGSLTGLRITHSPRSFRVEADGSLCFETTRVHLPTGYHYGISAVTSETPDSYELFSVLLSSPERIDLSQAKESHYGGQTQLNQEHHERQEKSHGRTPHEEDYTTYNPEYEDESPEKYKTDHDQFVDVHNRLQGITHHLAAIQSQIGMLYDRVDSLNHRQDDYRSELKGTRIPRSQVDGMEEKMKVIEDLVVQIGHAITSNDYSQHFEALHKTLENHHSNLLYSVPNKVTQALSTSTPKVGFGVTLLIVFQLVLVVAYIVYKRRRASSPKKYL
ncbi:concanavalin A-like lectin/glucanase [Choiromyces venosus 120613-1]|uniref:Concanavalin A-like lectin/glucanase n=1 Tax=Choiromyces venosus 120613-1 TaxID=1336337 RepID=A0A3N4J792_9PEZI|nr:concanavalin A-like lectin/glucanase [Choiromyces venosus 120613-1]